MKTKKARNIERTTGDRRSKHGREANPNREVRETSLPWRRIMLVAAIAGASAIILQYLLERFVFQIIDFSNVIGINQKAILLPMYTIPALIPDILDILLGLAGVSIGTLGRNALLFLFNAVLYGGMVAVYAKWGRRAPKRFWSILALAVLLVFATIYVVMW